VRLAMWAVIGIAVIVAKLLGFVEWSWVVVLIPFAMPAVFSGIVAPGDT